MTDTVIVNLPFFPGFYESMLSGALDNAEEREAEYSAEKEESAEFYPETYQPEELRLSESEYGEILVDCMNYRAAHNAMAADYADAFDRWAADNLETAPGSFTFESMDSPREYNFTTDRVYVTVPLAVMESLFNSVDREKLAETISQRHSSRSGFISFYANDLESWLEKPLEEFDHNEYGTLLVAAMAPLMDDKRDFNWQLCEGIFESDYEYVDQHCDWQKFERLAREKRAEKLAQWMREDSNAAACYIATVREALEILPLALDELDSSEREQWAAATDIHAENRYRCPYTLELPFPRPEMEVRP